MNTRNQVRALVVVMAFGCGVLATDLVREHRYVQALRVADDAIAVAEDYAQVCGLPPPMVTIVEPRR